MNQRCDLLWHCRHLGIELLVHLSLEDGTHCLDCRLPRKVLQRETDGSEMGALPCPTMVRDCGGREGKLLCAFVVCFLLFLFSSLFAQFWKKFCIFSLYGLLTATDVRCRLQRTKEFEDRLWTCWVRSFVRRRWHPVLLPTQRLVLGIQGTKLQQSCLYSSFCLVFLFFFSLESIFSGIHSLECLTVQLYTWLCQPKEEIWLGNKWAGAEEDRTALCSCTGLVFLGVFVTVKTSCSFNCYPHDSCFCIKYLIKYICLAGPKYFGKYAFSYKQVSVGGRVQVNNWCTDHLKYENRRVVAHLYSLGFCVSL